MIPRRSGSLPDFIDKPQALPESVPSGFLPLTSEAVRLSAEIKIKFSHGEKNSLAKKGASKKKMHIVIFSPIFSP